MHVFKPLKKYTMQVPLLTPFYKNPKYRQVECQDTGI